MKGKRHRNAQKTLLFYKLHFGITGPYRLLVDGTICNTAYSNHINLAEQVPKLFQADVKIYTTQCAISEVEGLQSRFGVSRGTSLTILKQFPVLPCHHLLAGDVKDCFSSKYRNNTDNTSEKNKFCVGTQDQEIRDHARKHGGVPIFVLKSKVPHIEPPSEKSKIMATQLVDRKAMPEHSKKQLVGIKRVSGTQDAPSEPEKKKRKKPQAPNPLSCMKKKPKPPPNPSTNEEGKKSRRRKRKRNSIDNADLVTLIKKATEGGT